MIGIVIDRKSRKPIAGANVQLYIPALPKNPAVSQTRNSARERIMEALAGRRARQPAQRPSATTASRSWRPFMEPATDDWMLL